MRIEHYGAIAKDILSIRKVIRKVIRKLVKMEQSPGVSQNTSRKEET